MTALETAPTAATTRPPDVRRRPGLGAALRWEVRKLRAQVRTRAVLLGALLGPVPVVVVIHGQSRPPKDTLFGRFATDNGFALALLVLAPAIGAALLVAAIAARLLLIDSVHRLCSSRTASPWLLPLRDMLSFFVFLGGFVTGSVDWRGERLRMDRHGNIAADAETL